MEGCEVPTAQVCLAKTTPQALTEMTEACEAKLEDTLLARRVPGCESAVLLERPGSGAVMGGVPRTQLNNRLGLLTVVPSFKNSDIIFFSLRNIVCESD